MQAGHGVLKQQVSAADGMRDLKLRVERIVHEQVGLQLVQLVDVLLARHLFVKRLAADVLLARVLQRVIILQRHTSNQSSELEQEG